VKSAEQRAQITNHKALNTKQFKEAHNRVDINKHLWGAEWPEGKRESAMSYVTIDPTMATSGEPSQDFTRTPLKTICPPLVTTHTQRLNPLNAGQDMMTFPTLSPLTPRECLIRKYFCIRATPIIKSFNRTRF